MNRSARAAALAAVLLLSLSSAAIAQGSKAIVGTWTLVSNVNTEGGKATPIFGEKPLGQVSFSANGRYTLIITRNDLPKFGANNRLKGTDKEKSAVNDGMIAHFGKYTVDDKAKVITLHVEASTFPNWNGTEQKRAFSVSGNELRWSNAAASGGGVAELVWKKS